MEEKKKDNGSQGGQGKTMVDYFKTFQSKECQCMSIEQVVDIIRSDAQLKASTEMYRKLLGSGKAKLAKETKEGTPQISVSFRMDGGKGKENCRECLYELLIDFDAKAPGERLSPEELDRVKTILRTSYHARLGYESISGLGYHIIVPFYLPDGVTIDLVNDRERGEKLFKRAHRIINNMYSVWCKHKMDDSCGNINRMTGLCHDPGVVYRPDARPFTLSREELGIDANGNLVQVRTPRQAIDASGNRISVPLGDHLERAVKMLEDNGEYFVSGNHHNYIMRLSFMLNRMGVNQEEAAQAVDEAYAPEMKERPSHTLNNCYKTAAEEFGAWLPKRSSMEVKTDIIGTFLKEKSLRYDILTQKTQQKTEDGIWKEMTERDENDLYMECCSKSDQNLTLKLFLTVLNSSVVPAIHPLREYLLSLPEWKPGMPDYIAQAAQMVHTASEQEDRMWAGAFPKWFVAMVAGWMGDETVNHQVIVLIGAQGIYKSTWLNRLMPPQLKAYATDNIDIDHLDKDEQLRAAEFGLINIDELDKLTDRQLNKLKAMVTTGSVDVRASYGRHKEKRTRVASYAASGNKHEFLTDQTGNRRWLPFNVVSIDSPYEHTLPYEGMYSQALYLMRSGYRYWFDLSDIQHLSDHVEGFMVPTSEEQLVMVYFKPIAADAPCAEFLTLAEISAKLTTHGALRKDIDLRRLGAIMKKLGFVQARNGHNRTRGYIVYERTTDEVDKMRDARAL